MTHFCAAILIDVEVALGARGCVRATTRVDLELVSRINLVILNVAFRNFGIFVIYKGIVVQDTSTGTMTQAEERGDLPSL